MPEYHDAIKNYYSDKGGMKEFTGVKVEDAAFDFMGVKAGHKPKIRKAIKKNTKLVIVNHASNVSGVVQDIKAIGAVCKEEGIQFAVDTAQTAGVLPIDMVECNIS